MIEQIPGAPRSKGLLVGHGGKGETPLQSWLQPVQESIGKDRGGGSGLHVASATAKNSTVADLASPRIDAPACCLSNREHVDVTVQNQMTTRPAAIKGGDDIGHFGLRSDDAKRDPFL